MEVKLSSNFILTTNSSASSSGRPVLVKRATGEVYGPGDMIQLYPSWGSISAKQAVERMAAILDLDSEQRHFIDAF